MFGSVTTKDIAEALMAQHNLDMDKRKIELKEAIKTLGTYPLTIKIHPQFSATIQAHVVGQ